MALALLLRRSRAAASTGNPEAYDGAVRAAILDGRGLAVVAGVSRLRSEFASLGLPLGDTTLKPVDAISDMRRAKAVAHRHARRVSTLARSEGIGLARASDLSSGSLRRIGVTESADAFSKSRLRVVRAQVPATTLFRVWDAALDKRTCSICERQDGLIVGANESFPAGEPGSVHPLCRCNWTLLRGDEVDRDMIIEAA